MSQPNSNKGKGRPALVIGLATAIVAAASIIGWEKLSDGRIKDYNLVSDLMPDSAEVPEVGDDASIMTESQGIDSLGVSQDDIHSLAIVGGSDSAEVQPVPPAPCRVGDMVVIEDYTTDHHGLRALRSSLAAGQLARIAVVGDSYIEGDIMTQDLRSQLQSRYGGSGVGYMNLHSEFPGFRRSVVQGGSGWKSYTATKRGKAAYMGLSEQYSTPSGNAKATYEGTSKVANCDSWTASRVLFCAPNGGTLMTRASSEGEWTTHTLPASEEVGMVETIAPTSRFELKISDPSVAMLGVWLDSEKGISVDCMSSRGIPGYSLASISPELCASMRRYVNYDLIILEFGINAMSAKQSNYTTFTRNMVKVVDNLRNCYPGADIMIIGVGDRGQKRGGAYHSMSTIGAMIDAQRKAAMESRCLFWDTREAMGGEDAIVEWARDGRANKDYIHLTHKGGASLATSLFNAIKREIEK